MELMASKSRRIDILQGEIPDNLSDPEWLPINTDT